MKINRSLGLLALAMLTVSSANSAPPPGLPTKATQLIRQTNALRGKAVNATPANAAQVLNNLTDFANNLKRNINSWLPGKSAAGLRNNVLTNLNAVMSPSVPQLKKKIEQAKAEAAQKLADAQKAADAEAARSAKEVQEAADAALAAAAQIEADAEAARLAAARMPKPSAPPEPAISIVGWRQDIPKGLAPVTPIVGFKHKVSYAEALKQFLEAGKIPIENALAVVAHNENISSANVYQNEEALNKLYTALILPFMIANFQSEHSRGPEGIVATTIDTLMRSISSPIRWLAGDMPIPKKGEFDRFALQVFQDWVTYIANNIKNKNLARKFLQTAISRTNQAVSRFRAFHKKIPAEEQNARIMLAAHILRVLNELYPQPESGLSGERREIEPAAPKPMSAGRARAERARAGVKEREAAALRGPAVSGSSQRRGAEQPAPAGAGSLDRPQFGERVPGSPFN